MREPFVTARSAWKRLLLGSLLIVVTAAVGTAAAGLNELQGFVHQLDRTPAPELGGELSPAAPGGAQTILLMGSDKRAHGAIDAANPPHTDTVMLLRIDPSQSSITVMSIPRDLAVELNLPGRGQTPEKINAAYSIGGPKLALATVESVLGVRINHLVDTNFAGFKNVVDYLGCVYVDVDHRYYNDNTGPQQYATINVPAGYQRLCGQDALDYVRYRHTDSDFVRVARQQDFLRQVKDQLGSQKILSERQTLAKIFGENTETDIHSTGAVLQLLEILVGSAGHPIRQVHFQATAGPSYVTATADQLHKTIADFLGPPPAAKQSAPAPPPAAKPGPRRPAPPAFEQAPQLGLGVAQQMTSPGLPVEYPALLVNGATYDTGSRAYSLTDDRGVARHAYRIVVKLPAPGDYYGIEGTDWPNPPLVRHPSETRTIGGRRFELFYAGQKTRLVAWRSGGDVYWLSNSLLSTLSEPQMLALAASTTAAPEGSTSAAPAGSASAAPAG